MSQSLKLSENPLLQAHRALIKIRKLATICMYVPIPILPLTTAVFFHFKPDWYFNVFLASIYAVFAFGQVLAVLQMRRVLAGVRNTAKGLDTLMAAGDEPDLEALRLKLLETVPPGHLRDLVLRWIELGLRGETHGADTLLENAWERRSIADGRALSLHVSVNRTTLKLGFLGTLYGLIETFPPMKRAVMGLADSEGELKFIKDISLAIDGDEFAIMVTLVATALSILIELVTLQILERALGGFDLVNSHINDWNLTRLQPWIRRRYGNGGDSRKGGGQEDKLAQSHVEMDRNIARLTEAMGRTTLQLEQLAQLQAAVGKRVAELADFEKQYRGFLSAKQHAVAPTHLRVDTGNGQ